MLPKWPPHCLQSTGTAACLLIILVWCPALPAQVTSRAEEIQAARQEKAQRLEPEEVSETEATLLYIKEQKILERISAGVAGFRLKLGGLVTGEYFAAEISGDNPKKTVTAYVRKKPDGGEVVGIDRAW